MEEQHERDPDEAIQPFEFFRKSGYGQLGESRENGSFAPEPMEVDPSDEEAIEKFIEKDQPVLKRKRGRKKKKKLFKERGEAEIVKKLEGQALLAFATQQYEEAEKLCKEIIKISSNNYSSYHTLGNILQERGELKKALDYFMIAAHLTPKDLELWRRLAYLSTQVGYVRQSIHCYSVILRHNKDDLEAQWDRALLYAEINETKKAIEALESIETKNPENPEIAKILAKLYNKEGFPERAIEKLEEFLRTHQQHADLTHINILADLYIHQGLYSNAALLIDRAERTLALNNYLPVELKAKAGLCFAHTGDKLEADKHLKILLEQRVDEYSDLFYSTANALAELGYKSDAFNFYQALCHTDMTGPDLWKSIWDCKIENGGFETVAEFFVDFSSNLPLDHSRYLEATLLAIKALLEAGYEEEAATQMKSLNLLLDKKQVFLPRKTDDAAAAIFLKEELEFQIGQSKSFLNRMLPVVLRSILKIKKQLQQSDEIDFPKDLMEALNEMKQREEAELQLSCLDSGIESDSVFMGYCSERQRARYEKISYSSRYNKSDPLILNDMFWDDKQFSTFKKVVDILCGEGRWPEVKTMLLTGLQILIVNKRSGTMVDHKNQLRMKLTHVYMELKEYTKAMEQIRYLCLKYPTNVTIWNAYCKILGRMQSVKWLTKGLTVLREMYPTCVPIMMVLAHMLANVGEHKEALGEYIHAYRLLPKCPLVLLCMGIAFVNCSLKQKKGENHAFVLKGFSFLKEYEKYRLNPQESNYNLGRAAHELGLLHLAVPYYTKALVLEPAKSACDLKRQIAYNLVSIYKSTGAVELARDVMVKYLTI